MTDSPGGERPKHVWELGSPLLRRHGRELAAVCFRRCYETWPELEARYGARGRQFVAEDAFWHLEHLDMAVELGESVVFVEYARWLTGLLRARGIEPAQVAGVFGFLAEALEAVECRASQERQRGELVAVLREGQARVLEMSTDG